VLGLHNANHRLDGSAALHLLATALSCDIDYLPIGKSPYRSNSWPFFASD
jgi:hypothetical protein